MKRIISAAIVTALSFGQSAQAGDHLYPDESVVAANSDDAEIETSYDRLIASVLKDGFAPDVSVRVFMGGSTVVAESLVGVRGARGNKRLFGISPNENLFAYAEIEAEKLKPHPDLNFITEMQKGMPASPSYVTLYRCEVPVDDAFASGVEAIWTNMLRATRYDTDSEMESKFGTRTVLVDAGVQRFASSGFAGQARGAWDSAKNDYNKTDVGQLSRLASTMGTVCYGHGKGLADLKREVSDFLHHLREKQP